MDRKSGRVKRLRRVVLTGANQLREACEARGYRGAWAMYTLTYRPDVEWSPRHITEFRQRAAEHLKRRGIKLRGVWVAELTKAGRVHYHVLVWLPRGRKLPMPDKQGWWTHGATNSAYAQRAFGYLAKYLSKGADGIGKFPKGLRTYALLGLDASQREVVRWWAAPGWVRESFPAGSDPRPAEGGGWVSRVTGEWRASPWVVVLLGKEIVLLPRDSLPDPDYTGICMGRAAVLDLIRTPGRWTHAVNDQRSLVRSRPSRPAQKSCANSRPGRGDGAQCIPRPPRG